MLWLILSVSLSVCVHVLKDILHHRFDGSDQAELHGKAFCIDPVYNVLWTHSVANQLVCCYNPIAAGIQGNVYA